ncbi:MAG: S41 family peptidase [Rhodospirillaceae bacterium]|nr:S41 family peptidase [Rhodospirillaceae bacterium]
MTFIQKTTKFSTALLFSAGAAVMSAVPLAAQAADTKFSNDTYKYLELFGDVFERVRRDYVEEVTDQELLESAINGMLTSLDPHSGYLPAKSFQDMQEQTKGEFGGLGIELNMENGLVRVVSPIDDTPAAKAGVQPGDYIIAIDAKPIIGLTLNEAVEKMRGAPDTELTITIRRQGVDPFDLKLKRAIIKVQSVRSRVEGDVGYIRVTSFNEQTQTGLENAVKDLNTKLGGKLKGYVLDLRNNPGGLLDQAVSVSDSFLERGEIVSTRTRRLEDTQRYNAKAGDLAQGKPLVVLINDGSASASEIVAGALQDHGRAVLLGVKSFGKGSVQTIIPLGRGESAMRLTTARYYTPSGRSIQATGIEPDIEVKQALIQRPTGPRFNRSEADLPGALRNETTAPQSRNAAPPAATPPANATPPAPGALNAPGASNTAANPNAEGRGTEDTEDYQLARALDLLRGISIYQRSSLN